MNTQKLRAASYSRVSTEEEKQLNALAKQIQENRDIISQMGWELANEYIDEGKSGTQTKKRDAYNQLFQDLGNNDFDIVVIKDQDRLMRNPKDWYLFTDRLLKNGKKLYIHLDNSFYNPDNALLTGIKAILAEEYSRHLSRKVNNAHRNRQEKGESVIITNQTWGYQKMSDGSVQIDERERPLIELIFNMYAKGMGSRLICKELSNRGIRNRKGNVFAESQIRAIVRNPLYMGVVVMNKTHINFDTKQKERIPETEWKYHENMVPPIVSEEVWQTANQAIDLNSKRSAGKTVGVKTGSHMLSGKVSCGECGQKFWRNQRNTQRKSGREAKVVYWYCSEYYRYGKKEEKTGNGCSSLRLKEEELLGILQKIGKSIVDKESRDNLLHKIVEKVFLILEDKKVDHQIEALKSEKANLTVKKEKLLDLLIDGTLNREDYQKRLGEITAQMEAIEELEKQYEQRETTREDVRARMDQIQAVLARQTHDLSVPVVASHVDQIKIFASRIDIYLDFLKPLRPVMALADMANGRRFFSLFREEETAPNQGENESVSLCSQLGRSLPGGRESDSGRRPRPGQPQRKP